MRRCAIYTRQSSVPYQKETSCHGQFERCHAFLTSRTGIGWQWIGERLDDPGFSGATMDRPALQKLLGLVEAGSIDVIIVEYLDRLSRSVYDTLHLLQRFRANGIEVCIVTSPDLSLSPSDNFMINLMSSFAEFERDLIRERIRETRQALKLKGRRVGGAVPYGYTTRPPSTKLVSEAKESRRVQLMYDWAANGKTPAEIATLANKRRWRTRARISLKTGERLGDKPWTARQVLAVLSNPVYVGLITHNRFLRDGEHDAIISDSIWEQARAAIRSRKNDGDSFAPFSHTPLLFKGKVKCAHCGKNLTQSTTRNGPIVHRYYRCRTAGCKRVLIQAGIFDSRLR
jgi:site-specific DNA recombinase